MIKKLAVSCAVLLLSAGFMRADQGTTAASFLKLAVGPRSIGMGANFAGLADDVEAMHYNASGMSYLKNPEVTLMHAVWFQDIYYDHAAAAFPIQGVGTIGVDLLYLNGGQFDKYTMDTMGNPVPDGQFTANDMAIGLAYTRAIVPSISAGLLVKYIAETIDSSSTSGIAVDVSGMYKTPFPGLSLGANVENLGPSMGFNTTYGLPINFRLGAGYKPLPNASVDVDYTQPVETAGILGIGGEYGYKDFLFVRGGYKYQGAIDYNEVETGYGPAVAAGLSLGIGVKYSSFYVDYAYVPFGFLGTTHRFGLTYKFQSK